MTFLTEYLGGKVLDIAWDGAKQRLLGKRLETARRLLIEELSRGNATLADVEDADEAAAMVFEYADAAARGTARRNLRFLAQLLAGEVVRKPMYADDFLRWSGIIAQLSQDELIVLATLHQEAAASDHPQMPFINTQDKLLKSGVVKDQNDLLGHLQALTRTGFILQGPLGNASMWHFTTAGNRVMEMARMNDVLAEPPR
jgi:hypothetical protein